MARRNNIKVDLQMSWDPNENRKTVRNALFAFRKRPLETAAIYLGFAFILVIGAVFFDASKEWVHVHLFGGGAEDSGTSVVLTPEENMRAVAAQHDEFVSSELYYHFSSMENEIWIRMWNWTGSDLLDFKATAVVNGKIYSKERSVFFDDGPQIEMIIPVFGMELDLCIKGRDETSDVWKLEKSHYFVGATEDELHNNEDALVGFFADGQMELGEYDISQSEVERSCE